MEYLRISELTAILVLESHVVTYTTLRLVSSHMPDELRYSTALLPSPSLQSLDDRYLKRIVRCF